MYYKDAIATIVVDEVTNIMSFNGMKRWINELKEKGPKDIPIFIAGNKSDLIRDQKVDLVVAKEYADEVRATLRIVSAKENINITEIFQDIAFAVKNSVLIIDHDKSESECGDKVPFFAVRCANCIYQAYFLPQLV